MASPPLMGCRYQDYALSARGGGLCGREHCSPAFHTSPSPGEGREGVAGWGPGRGPGCLSRAGERRAEADRQHGGHADQRGDQPPAQGEAGAGGGGRVQQAAARGLSCMSHATPWLLCSVPRPHRGARALDTAPAAKAPVLQFRAESVVPARMAEMTRCIQERDFQAFGQLTMKDSNQFHATCLDTFPPISYLNDISRRIVRLVHCFNAHHGQTKARRRGLWRPACDRASGGRWGPAGVPAG